MFRTRPLGELSARLSSRPLAHTAGLVAAAVLAMLVLWLAWRGYRQPELLIDFANMRVC